CKTTRCQDNATSNLNPVFFATVTDDCPGDTASGVVAHQFAGLSIEPHLPTTSQSLIVHPRCQGITHDQPGTTRGGESVGSPPGAKFQSGANGFGRGGRLFRKSAQQSIDLRASYHQLATHQRKFWYWTTYISEPYLA